MQLKGMTFCFDVPDDWESTHRPGHVIAASPTPVLGFAPNAVLRESRIEDTGDALAAVSQARLRASENLLPGTLPLGVQALVRHDVEHRRLWFLLPLQLEALHGNVLSVLGMQEIAVVDEVVAELTVTVPLVGWSPGDGYHAMLDTLRPLPSGERMKPLGMTEVAAAELDEWATARDGVPREQLSGAPPTELVLQAPPIVLSNQTAEHFLANAANRVFAPVTGEVRQELAAGGIVDDTGNLTPDGFWYVDHILSGQSRKISFAGPGRNAVRFWFTDPSAVFVIPHPEQEGHSLLGFCPSNDLFRLVLSWAGLTLSWPMEVRLELEEGVFRAKADHGVVPEGHDGDAAEFLTEDWQLTSLSGPNGSILTWVHTRTRGDAMVRDGSRLDNTILIEQDPSEPFWWTVIEAMVKEGEE
ncbi:hypothetical protein EII34_13165 [Arachnia propionica]|uniref:Uncharacterized protein n=1 Tax=Arachnia propionica TaxID=1750 RepID=A0A3P1T2P5_9ACTN|nr:hypothetical protein [Arachnia propionica]RRD03538.1 hypothetical protein EII34_13165 [Arachnia propionica]